MGLIAQESSINNIASEVLQTGGWASSSHSSSGNSKNILAAVDVAVAKGLHITGLTGGSGGQLAAKCACIKIPSMKTERIQEGHILVGHVLCGLIEDGYFLKS